MNGPKESKSAFLSARKEVNLTAKITKVKQIIDKKSAVSQETHLVFIDRKTYNTIPISELQETKVQAQ